MINKKILITGFSGFVSRHFLAYLQENDKNVEIYGVDMNPPRFDYSCFNFSVKFHILNLLEPDSVKTILKEFKPHYILHLASFSSVAYSWEHPIECFQNNTNIFLNLIASVQQLHLECRVLSVGSSEEYGNVKIEDLPLCENSNLFPCSPYAVARVSQEMLSHVYAKSYDVNIVMTRSFNHIGPWQDTRFVVPSFISRILKIKQKGKNYGVIETGNLSIIRDFIDVRDVVSAYYKLLLYGKSGELYNVCSGKGTKLSDIIKIIAQVLEVEIDTVITQKYVRKDDNDIIIGSYKKIKEEIGWVPKIPINITIRDMIFDCNNQKEI